ncbi:MAG: SCO family protein [Actinomycetota bacterium]|nr:SCO family protein [Actinomycetota bacterium]
MGRRRALVGTVLVLLFIVAAACGSGPKTGGGGVVSGVTTSDGDGYAGALLTRPYVVPEISLTSTHGPPFSLTRDTAGRLTVVFFGYTRCPDVCQVVMGTIASAYARLDKAAKAKVQVAFVTTDPGRDTPTVLRAYLDRLNPAFVGLTGKISDIVAAGKPLGVFIQQGHKLPSGGYDVSHTTSVIAIGSRGKAPLVWSATTSPDQMATDIDKLLKKKV